MTDTTKHLVGVWNPSYEADAMDEHIEVLLRHARAFRDGKADNDEVYVWWGSCGHRIVRHRFRTLARS